MGGERLVSRGVVTLGDEAVQAELVGIGVDAGEARGMGGDAHDFGAEGAVAGAYVEDGAAGGVDPMIQSTKTSLRLL